MAGVALNFVVGYLMILGAAIMIWLLTDGRLGSRSVLTILLLPEICVIISVLKVKQKLSRGALD